MNRSGAPADSCFLHPQSLLMRGLGWQCSPGDALWCLSTSASFSYTLSINQCFMPLTTNLTPLLVRKELQDGLALENMLVMLTHKLLDDDTKKLLYRSAVRPSDSAHPNKHLVPDGEESSQTPKPIIFVRSRQDDSQSATKPMAEYIPDDLIGRTFLLPKTEQGERLRATIKRKVIDI